MNPENELDDLFKKRLEDPVDNQSYSEADWDALEQMLDKQKKPRGVVYWLPVFGSVAALLLLFLGYMVFRPKTAGPKPAINNQAVVPDSAHSGKSGGSIRQQTDQSSKASKPVAIAKNLTSGTDGGNHKPFQPLSAYGARRNAGLVKQDLANQANNRSDELLTAPGTSYALGSTRIDAEPIYVVKLAGSTRAAITPENKSAAGIKKPAGYRPQFALTVMAAPDINGVGSFQQSKVGTNEGLLFSAGLSRKLTVSTGAIYSIKPYITGFENYHTAYQFPVNPINVTADCRMLDVPINIGYQIFNKHQNSISVGTGLSSYIMLHESYKFNYGNAYYTGPAQYTVPNADGYYFAILNLNATFQHQVNSKVGVTFQPYVKLPLTSVGYSQVRLQTTGVALGLTWNLNSPSKP
jgi:hypothetical protein